MKRPSILFAILVAALSILTAPSCAQQQNVPSETQRVQITIVNNTGFPIWFVHISPSTNDDWGPNFLDDDQIIESDESVTLDLPSPGEEQYDILLEGSVGDIHIKYNEKVVANDTIVFTFDDIDIWRYLR